MSSSKYERQSSSNRIFRRSKTQNNCEKFRQESSLEKMACLSLYELSQITDDLNIKGSDFPQKQKIGYSPWKIKNSQPNEQSKKQKKRISLKQQKRVKSTKRLSLPIQKYCSKQQISFYRYPSIFMKLKTVKQSKYVTEIKMNSNNQDNIVDNNIWLDKTESKQSSLVLVEKRQQLNAESSINKIQKLDQIKKKSLNLIKKVPCCFFEFEKQSLSKENKPAKKTDDYWKARKPNIKSKKCKQFGKFFGKRDKNKQTSLTKMNTLYSQKSYNQEYKSINPLTRQLYEKYINTISLSHSIKDSKCDFL